MTRRLAELTAALRRARREQPTSSLTFPSPAPAADLESPDPETLFENYAPVSPRRDSQPLLARLLELAPVGLHLTRPWRVVIAGPPNAGKSSLMNALLGYPRAIVCEQAGTTRDLLTAETALDGWLIEFTDTAGLRETADSIEAAGVALARAQLAHADLMLFVADASGPEPSSHDLPGELPAPAARIARVANKIDLPPAARGWSDDWVRVSARHGAGIDQLADQIVKLLIPRIPQPGEAVPFSTEQVARLRQMQDDWSSGRFEQAWECGEQILRGSSASAEPNS